jgi:hypothetical protein
LVRARFQFERFAPGEPLSEPRSEFWRRQAARAWVVRVVPAVVAGVLLGSLDKLEVTIRHFHLDASMYARSSAFMRD